MLNYENFHCVKVFAELFSKSDKKPKHKLTIKAWTMQSQSPSALCDTIKTFLLKVFWLLC